MQAQPRHRPPSDPTLSDKIGRFYDESSLLWERTWGEHMHHGYYGITGRHRKDRRQAQIDLIDELLQWAAIDSAGNVSVDTILDVGCGIGGSTLYLANRFSAKAVGITLSPVQAKRAGDRAQELSIPRQPWQAFLSSASQTAGQPLGQTAEPITAPAVDFAVANALSTPFADNAFDFIWSMESGEHMPDKTGFLQECHRLLKPGGTFLMATWCHRETDNLAGPLTWSEQQQLKLLYELYHLPYVISLSNYADRAATVGFSAIDTADWSTQVEFFWQDVVRSAMDPKVIAGIFEAGTETIRGTAAITLMTTGFQSGLIRYGLLKATKPSS
jgi:tocopherol O-methyltransferase